MTPTSLFFIWGVGVGVGGSIGIHGENGDDTNITIYIFYVFFGGGWVGQGAFLEKYARTAERGRITAIKDRGIRTANIKVFSS
jgi:hypothetical protein